MSHQANAEFALVLEDILDKGSAITTRNATTKRLRNRMITFDDTPLISVRRTAWKNALREFEWFLSGSSNINDLHEKVHPWWKPWANEDLEGVIQNNYSKQFREFHGVSHPSGITSVDQIEYLQNCVKNHPYGRRAVATTWNTAEMVHEDTPITNCHGTIIQAFVEPDNSLHLTMYQRSCDMVLGVPHNWIQYWAFLMWLAHHGGRTAGSFTWIGGDCHIYPDHVKMAKKIVGLDLEEYLEAPELVYKPTSEEFKADDFSLSGEYDPIIKESLKMTV